MNAAEMLTIWLISHPGEVARCFALVETMFKAKEEAEGFWANFNPNFSSC